MRRLIALAISTHMPLSEVETWDDRAIDTAWELLEEAEDEAKNRR